MTCTDIIGFAYNPAINKSLEFVNSLVKDLDLSRSSWIAPASNIEIDKGILDKTSVVITVGGDGTILRVAKSVMKQSIPILGINLGRVGFMTELELDEALLKIPKYLSGSYRVEERMMLKAVIVSSDQRSPEVEFHALNDVVITRGSLPRLLDLDTRIDGVLLTTYRADGLIVSTPTGSTGYSLSAGGPILYPEAKQIIMQPLAAHLSFQTGLVVSDQSHIELKMNGNQVSIVSIDGSNDNLEHDQKVILSKSPYVAKFLRKEGSGEFYANLTQKLGVAGRQVPNPKII